MSELKQCGACSGCANQCRHEAENPPAFAREDRYIVIKRAELEKIHPHVRKAAVSDLDRFLAHHAEYAPRREFLVIERDWPEYEPAWQMIERRMTDQQPPALDGEPERWTVDWGCECVEPDPHGLYVTINGHRAHVARLQAIAVQAEQDFKDVVSTIDLRDMEISRLQAEVDEWKKQASYNQENALRWLAGRDTALARAVEIEALLREFAENSDDPDVVDLCCTYLHKKTEALLDDMGAVPNKT